MTQNLSLGSNWNCGEKDDRLHLRIQTSFFYQNFEEKVRIHFFSVALILFSIHRKADVQQLYSELNYTLQSKERHEPTTHSTSSFTSSSFFFFFFFSSWASMDHRDSIDKERQLMLWFRNIDILSAIIHEISFP